MKFEPNVNILHTQSWDFYTALTDFFPNSSTENFQISWSEQHKLNIKVIVFQFEIFIFSKPGGLDVETNRDRDRERP